MIFYIAFKLAFVLHFIYENINWSIFWSAFSAIGTVSAVIVAYWQIKKQIELSNKQFPVSYTHLTLPTICSV